MAGRAVLRDMCSWHVSGEIMRRMMGWSEKELVRY